MDTGIVAGLTYLLLSLIGLFFNVCLTLFLWNNKNKEARAFHTLLLQLTLVNIGRLLLNALFAAPCSILRAQIVGNVAGEVIANFDTLFFYAAFATTVVISLHRLTVVGQIHWLMSSFHEWRFYLTLGCCWIPPLFWLITSNVTQCRKLFSETYYYFGYFCKLNSTNEESFVSGVLSFELSGTIVTGVIYAVSFVLIVKERKKLTIEAIIKKRLALERRLFCQEFATWVILTLDIIVFLTVPYYFPNFGGTLATNSLDILSVTTNPIVSLVVNKENRKVLATMLSCGRFTKFANNRLFVSTIEPTVLSTHSKRTDKRGSVANSTLSTRHL